MMFMQHQIFFYKATRNQSYEIHKYILVCSCCFIRFSQFFISPLVKMDAMEREVLAVDSGIVIFVEFILQKSCCLDFLIELSYAYIIWTCC